MRIKNFITNKIEKTITINYCLHFIYNTRHMKQNISISIIIANTKTIF